MLFSILSTNASIGNMSANDHPESPNTCSILQLQSIIEWDGFCHWMSHGCHCSTRWYGCMTSLERQEELWCITGPRSESILRRIQWRSLLYASWMSLQCHVRPVSHTKINWDYQLTSHQPLWILISLCFLSKVVSRHLCTESVCARVCYYYIF